MERYKYVLIMWAIAVITLELAILSEVVLSDGAPCEVSVNYGNGNRTHVSYGVVKREQ